MAQTFEVPTLFEKRKGWGSLSYGDARKEKGGPAVILIKTVVPRGNARGWSVTGTTMGTVGVVMLHPGRELAGWPSFGPSRLRVPMRSRQALSRSWSKRRGTGAKNVPSASSKGSQHQRNMLRTNSCGGEVVNSYRIGKSKYVNVIFLLLCAFILAPGSAVAQSCPSTPLAKCYNSFFVQTGQFASNWPPRSARLQCQNGTAESFSLYIIRNLLCPPRPQCPTCTTGGGPIDFATGDTYITESDVSAPGLGGGLSLSRTWNSISFEGTAPLGMFGLRWTSNLEENLFVGNDGFMKFLRGDGGIWSFGYAGNANAEYVTVGPANKTAALNENLTNWTMVFENGEQRVFDLTTGKLLSIADRNGNTTTLNYDASYRLVTVTDPAWRHLYFTYGSPSSFLVTGVSSDFGVSLSYSYDPMGRLTKVTKPDSTTVSFQYDSNGYISAVLDNSGKVLESHTYDSTGRGLTSSRAGGAESITVSYPQPQSYGGVFLTQ
jgi:YD repeat-containing protein